MEESDRLCSEGRCPRILSTHRAGILHIAQHMDNTTSMYLLIPAIAIHRRATAPPRAFSRLDSLIMIHLSTGSKLKKSGQVFNIM
jgi:hypothetical protein